MKAQGIPRETLPWKAPLQPYAAWVGFIGSTIITLVAGFPVFLKGNWSSSDFVASYIGIPIFIAPIIGWKLFHRTKVSYAPLYVLFLVSGKLLIGGNAQFIRASNIDLWSGRLQEGEIVEQTSPPHTLWGRFVDWLF
jgi:amino acid transporter